MKIQPVRIDEKPLRIPTPAAITYELENVVL